MQRSYYAIIPANVRYDKELPPNAKLLYGEITALCNEKGYCWATNSYFSDLYKVHNKSISRLISQLEKKGYITIEMIMEGKEVKSRHIYIAPSNNNEDTYPQKSVEGSNKNVTRGSNEIVTENTTSFNTTNNTNAYSNEFERFWSIYPKKVEKKPAYKAFKTCLKNKHDIETIIKGTEKYALQVKNTDKTYIKNPATFLNRESFIDEEVQEKEIPKQPVYETPGALAGFWSEEEYE